MATVFTVFGEAKSIAASERDPATIVNINSTGTVYYKTTADVSTSDTSIAAAASVEVTTPVYLIASASAPVKVQILRNADRQEQPFPESLEPIRTVDGPMKSGTSGTLAGIAEADTVAYDKSTKTHFVNEGTAASPYWTPTNISSPGLLGVYEDFRTLRGDVIAGNVPAITDTGTVNYTGAGARVLGSGLADTDSGLAAATDAAGYNVGRITASATSGKVIGLGGHVEAQFAPATNGTLVIDVSLTNVSAITARSLFIGWVGVAADNLAAVATGATTTATITPDELAGIFQSTGFTTGDALYLISEKANTSGTHTGLTSAGTLAAAATYQRFRVEIWPDGNAVAFLDKAQIGVIDGATGANTHAAGTVASTPATALIPVLTLTSLASATKIADVRRFMYWGKRVSA